MEQIRTFQIYAGTTFLGYEYAIDETEAIIKTHKKFGSPKDWNVKEYNAKIIRWREENETA